MANEEDTVTVGQDLVRLELGGAPEGGEKQKADAEPKDPASGEQSTSSDPDPSKKENQKPEAELNPAPQEKPEPKKETAPPKQSDSKKTESKASSSTPSLGNREERRV